MKKILKALVNKEIDIDTAHNQLQLQSIKKISDIAKLDMCREERTGAPEAILAENKDSKDVKRLALAMVEEKGYVLITRVKKEDELELRNIPEMYDIIHNKKAKTIIIKKKEHKFKKAGTIGVLSAGTADIAVAEEVVETAFVMGCEVIKSYDVGVAGMHRLYEPLLEMVTKNVCAIVVVAGMDAVLPIVVSGNTDIPVIGVPTSVGYGMGKDGVAGLMTMLQSCSPGLAVMNIDNGFGAGVFAGLIAKQKWGEMK